MSNSLDILQNSKTQIFKDIHLLAKKFWNRDSIIDSYHISKIERILRLSLSNCPIITDSGSSSFPCYSPVFRLHTYFLRFSCFPFKPNRFYSNPLDSTPKKRKKKVKFAVAPVCVFCNCVIYVLTNEQENDLKREKMIII